MYQNKRIILIAGDGGVGKDTVAKIISEISHLPYFHSTSWTAAKRMFECINNGGRLLYDLQPGQYGSVKECYDDRANHRKAWAEFISQINQDDQAALYKQCIEEGNQILTGIRKTRELQACYTQHIIDLSIFVCPQFGYRLHDLTMEYGPELCDIIVENPKTTDSEFKALRRKLTNLKWL